MQFRDNKNLQKGQFYHVFNRGNNKQDIFVDKQDFSNFLKRLYIILDIPYLGRPLKVKPLPKSSFTIVSYCLMTNHYHFFIRQNAEIPISKLVLKLCTSYSMYFNKKYNHIGHVFQDRFKAKLVTTDSYFSNLSAYIHLNPKDSVNYQYSSLKGILGLIDDPLCDKNIILNVFNNDPLKYLQFVMGLQGRPLDDLD